MADFYDRAAVGLLIEATSRHESAGSREVADAIRALHDHLEKGSDWTYSVACQKFNKVNEDIRAQIFNDATELAGAFASVTNVRVTLEGFLNNLSLRHKPPPGPGLLGAINR
ncbi:MAG: hypothetical protein WCO00_00800 [Rhodospirillaceae bacterium]